MHMTYCFHYPITLPVPPSPLVSHDLEIIYFKFFYYAFLSLSDSTSDRARMLLLFFKAINKV